MHVGILTAPFGGEPFETVLDFAEEAVIPALEVVAQPGSKHIDPAKLTPTKVKKIQAMLDERGLEISSLAYYDASLTDPKSTGKVQSHARKCIDAAAALGVPTLCMLAGFPAPGMSKIETIKNVLPKLFRPILTHARAKKINIALENWFATCLQGIDTFECLFETIPDKNFGLNYDPSHLYHQECDHLLPIAMFPNRIFHTHAKDTLVDKAKRAKVGVYGAGWWRYVIPGFGNIDWGEYTTHLRIAGYDGVLSIEHEDATQTLEEGFLRGASYLEQFC
ncbi:MAG TPA: sugar phosphate isomerase/epimerase [Candidatus Hydrogenedentes bacterium]|nr:sugar phosphate isomerase/epimerase [Candidatus Hydrogenedentota bacterium]HIJ73163.1 sugar phosphate isomerase/epimerase [Candidatus Hydrogenedentota bacterium]